MKYKQKPQAKYLVFLDIDGVFASNRVHFAQDSEYDIWARLDPVAMDFMNRIHDTYPVAFVLMSTWKDYLSHTDRNIKHWVESALRNAGFRGRLNDPWKTNPDDDMRFREGIEKDRAYQVKHYLDTYADNIDDYILFDDNRYQFNEVLDKKRLVLTDDQNGLLYKHMKNAASIMGQWKRK